MFRSSPSRRSTVLTICLLLTSLGCSSPPGGVRPVRPKEEVPLSRDEWKVPADDRGRIEMPYKDFRALMANRKRWIDYGKAWEVFHGE